MVKEWINQFIENIHYDEEFAREYYRKDSTWRYLVNGLVRDSRTNHRLQYNFNDTKVIEFLDFIVGNGYKIISKKIDDLVVTVVIVGEDYPWE